MKDNHVRFYGKKLFKLNIIPIWRQVGIRKIMGVLFEGHRVNLATGSPYNFDVYFKQGKAFTRLGDSIPQIGIIFYLIKKPNSALYNR